MGSSRAVGNAKSTLSCSRSQATMKATLFSLAFAGSAYGFVAPSAPRAALAAGRAGVESARSATTSARATPTMEFAGGLMGADGPEPNSKNFDPLGFSEARPDWVLFYREAEIKHGRIAMLAMVGLVAAEFYRIPGSIFEGVSVIEAHDAMVKEGPMVQLLLWLGLVETLTASNVIDMDKKDREPGDYALDPLGFCKNPDKKKRYQLAELKNGRLAMLAFSGAITQSVMTGHGYPYLY